MNARAASSTAHVGTPLALPRTQGTEVRGCVGAVWLRGTSRTGEPAADPSAESRGIGSGLSLGALADAQVPVGDVRRVRQGRTVGDEPSKHGAEGEALGSDGVGQRDANGGHDGSHCRTVGGDRTGVVATAREGHAQDVEAHCGAVELVGEADVVAHDLIQPQTPERVNHKSAVVLFEGAGGSTRGLHDAGYDTDGYEYWQPAVTCAQANGFRSHLHDLSDPSKDHLIPYAPLWWASPPCQPFSAAGTGDGEFDDRDGFPWLLRLVALRLPDVLIVENVKGLTFRKHSAYFCAVLEGFKALGYEVDWRVLCAADFGVPQTRERCIIICRRDGGPITWPMPTHCETGGMFTAPWVTMAQALGWQETEALTYHRGAGMSERHGERPPSPASAPAPTVHGNFGKDMRRVTLHYRQTNDKGELITCDVTDRPAPTIGTQSQSQWVIRTNQHTGSDGGYYERSINHPAPALTIRGDLWEVGEPGERGAIGDGLRLLTSEIAALQGFPAVWTWTGTKTQQSRMIGNAVPPALAHAVASVNRPALERAS